MNITIAAIVPLGRGDSSADTVLDGILELQKEHPGIVLHTSASFDSYIDLEQYRLERKEFFNYATSADIILLFYGKKKTDVVLAGKIDRWDRTIFIDGSEVGENLRFDFTVQRDILNKTFSHFGRVYHEMLSRCALYFRREKPYINGIIPLPFGIDSPYIAYQPSIIKDLDFTCVFGQDEYPLLRRYVREELKVFCKKHSFSCWTKKTATPGEFRNILARSRVGVSVGGGGYDTMRFWEVLGNNCLLLTERIDIYPLDSNELNYRRIYQFGSLYDFEHQLEKIAAHLRTDYQQDSLSEEYRAILQRHSSKARVMTIFHEARAKGII